MTLTTRFDNQEERDEAKGLLWTISDSLKLYNIDLVVRENDHLHDRAVRLSNGWTIKIGRGFDIYQAPEDWFHIGANDLNLRQCLETNVDVTRTPQTK